MATRLRLAGAPRWRAGTRRVVTDSERSSRIKSARRAIGDDGKARSPEGRGCAAVLAEGVELVLTEPDGADPTGSG